jgi:hypothetical protein
MFGSGCAYSRFLVLRIQVNISLWELPFAVFINAFTFHVVFKQSFTVSHCEPYSTLMLYNHIQVSSYRMTYF